MSPAHGCGGVRETIEFNNSPSAKKSGEARKQAGKKKKGCGENEFLPACLPAEGGLWGGGVSTIPLLRGRQNRKIFVSLIEKFFGGAQLKMFKKIFLFCSPSGERKRRAGLPPAGWQLKVAVRIFVKKGSDFNQKAPPIFRILILGDYCLALATLGLGFGKDFEGIFEVAKQFLPARRKLFSKFFVPFFSILRTYGT